LKNLVKEVTQDSISAIEAGKKGILLGSGAGKDKAQDTVRHTVDSMAVKANATAFVDKAATVKVTPMIMGAGGNVIPNTAQLIKVGERAKFKVTPNMGYKLRSITGCGVAADAKDEFETGSVVTDCNLQITFENSKIQMINSGGRIEVPSPGPGAPVIRQLPGVRPLINQPLQRKMVPLTPPPTVPEKQ
jgi:hypothetical protein